MAQESKLSLSITPQACVYGAVMLLTIPLPWVAAWVITAAAHELCHCLSLYLCGRRIERICIGAMGAKIQTQLLSDWETLFCAMAGPASGGFFILFAKYFPKLAVCALIQMAFNLLPVFPLDGGRALRSLANLLFPENFAAKLCTAMEVAVVVCLMLTAVLICTVWNLGITPILFVLLFLVCTKKIKFSCK